MRPVRCIFIRELGRLRPSRFRLVRPGGRACVRYNARPDTWPLQASPGGGPFSRTPEAGLYVVFPQQAPVPPPP
jgi:hypothetical protein